ncbi:MAG: hypothetical protein Q7R49_00240 [Candidatus Daviesbacteria bacterium]|nr:hypothetical protein [Candidatus Daviesbacteria bacterium]
MSEIPYNSVLELGRRNDWDWYQKTTGAFTLLANTERVVIDSKRDLPDGWRRGFLHSLDLQCDDNNLRIESKLGSGPARGPVTISGSLLELELAGFDQNIVAPGDPIIFDRTAEAIPVPEYILRVSPTFMYPFNQDFTWKLINNTTSDIYIYGHEVYMILFQEDEKHKKIR